MNTENYHVEIISYNRNTQPTATLSTIGSGKDFTMTTQEVDEVKNLINDVAVRLKQLELKEDSKERGITCSSF